MPDYLTGAALLCRRGALEQVGLLDESFFMYGEDVDWAVRARRAGWELWYCPHARVWHKENATGGYKSPFVEYWVTRANISLVRRYYPWRLPMAVACHAARASRRWLAGEWARGLAVVRGMRDGFAAAGTVKAGGAGKRQPEPRVARWSRRD